MAITQAMATSFKKELLQAQHNFTTSTGHTFNMALYLNTATLDSTDTVYKTSGEHATAGTYTAGGKALVIATASPNTGGTTAWADFDDLQWAASTITARGAMIYNVSASNKCVCVLDFGSDFTSTAGNFTVSFPAPAAGTAIIRLV